MIRRILLPAIACLLVAFVSPAATINITNTAQFVAAVGGPCAVEQGGTAPGCGSRAFIDSAVASSTSAFDSLDTFNGHPTLGEENFTSAFADWNGSHGNQWTLVDNGNPLNLTFNVSQFQATANQTVGGLNITVQLQNYVPGANDPTVNQLVWLQGLIISFRPPNGATTNPPFNTMDTFSFNQFAGGCDAVPGPPNANNNTTPSNVGASVNGYCDPLYPNQTADKQFVDTPKGGYALDSFRGIALLSTITTKTNGAGAVTERDVTVYGGVSYGFDVFVTPEPSTGAMLLGGVVLAFMVKRKATRDACR